LPGDDGIGIAVVAVATGLDPVNFQNGTGTGHVARIGELEGKKLGVVEVVDHHPVHSVIVMDKRVSGEIEVVVLGKVQVDLEPEVQVGQVWIVSKLIIVGAAG